MILQTVKNYIVLGITLPAALFTNLSVVSAQENFDQLELLSHSIPKNQILIAEVSETEELSEPSEPSETEDTTSESSETKKSGSTAVFQTLIRTVGDVIKTDIKTKRQQPKQNTSTTSEKENLEPEETQVPEFSEQTTESAPQVLGNNSESNSGSNNLATEKLAKWGWTKIPCKPQLVFIYGLGEDTICIEPNNTVSSGQYRYDSNTHQLQPVSSETGISENTPPTVADSK
ncbi:MAG: hypothetical protein AAF208_04640 [Cyanobacteria bacterium P01_A01_bin.45]